MNVALVILSQGYIYEMLSADRLVARGQGPAVSVNQFVAALAADPLFVAVSYAGALAAPPAKFTADLPEATAAGLGGYWQDPPPDPPP